MPHDQEEESIDHSYAQENGIKWKPEAWERVKHAPEFVSPPFLDPSCAKKYIRPGPGGVCGSHSADLATTRPLRPTHQPRARGRAPRCDDVRVAQGRRAAR